jgi:hypothetical protein
MTFIVIQRFGSPSAGAECSLPAMTKAVREKTIDAIGRMAAFEAGLAQRAASYADPIFAEESDSLWVAEDEAVSSSREPSLRAMLGALGIAASLLSAWISVQII